MSRRPSPAPEPDPVVTAFKAWTKRNLAKGTKPTGTQGLEFFLDMTRERPDVLGGYNWNQVHATLRDADLID